MIIQNLATPANFTGWFAFHWPSWFFSPGTALGLIFIGFLIIYFFHPSRGHYHRALLILQARPSLWIIPALGAALHGLIYFFHHQPATGNTQTMLWPKLSPLLPEAVCNTFSLLIQQAFVTTAPYGLSAVLIIIALWRIPLWLKKIKEQGLTFPRWLNSVTLYLGLISLLILHAASWLLPHDRFSPHPFLLVHVLVTPFFFAYVIITGFTLSRAPEEGQDQHLLAAVALTRWSRLWPLMLVTAGLAFINPLSQNLPWFYLLPLFLLSFVGGYFLILCVLQDDNPPLFSLFKQALILTKQSFFSVLWSLCLISIPLFLAVMLVHYLRHAPLEKTPKAISTMLSFTACATMLVSFILHLVITCEDLTREDEQSG